MLPIPKRRVDLNIGDPGVGALLASTSETFGVDLDGGLPAGFSPHTRGVTSASAGPTTVEWAQQRRHAGQSRGVRGGAGGGAMGCVCSLLVSGEAEVGASPRRHSSERREEEEHE